jgi:Mrp family chromosome partitioning ATPase
LTVRETIGAAPQPEMLRLAARLNPKVGEPAVVMICGIAGDEGVAALAVELGRSFALMRGGAILAADCRFSSPPEAPFAPAAGRAGIREAIAGAATLGEIETADTVPGLRLIGTGSAHAGGALDGPAALLGPDTVVLTDGLRARYRVAFLAVDPLIGGATALRLARAVDGVVLAIRAGIDRTDQVNTSISLLNQMEAAILGAVLVE